MQVGVFIPINNNGWLISESAPQYMPSFELNKRITLAAEKHGLDFVLSMIKLHGFGGKTQFWDHGLESFTLMAGLAAVTTRIKLYASVATLTVPPAIAARMAVTIDSISGGRFGLNLVTGWQKAEYAQMGLWPGESHFHRRYDMLDEYATVLRALWDGSECNMQGEFYRMEHCKLSPRPSVPIKLICAGQSTEGMKFTAKHADYCFSLGKGVNTPQAFAPVAARMADFAAAAGRQVETCVLTMVIADETDEAARAKWEHYKAGADEEAIAWMGGQAAQDKRVGADTNVRQLADAVSAVNINMSTLIGSYATVARMLDEMAAVPGCGGVMLTFDDFEQGVEAFGTRIQPLMQCRQHRNIAE
ncbi:MAG: pyrimidine utilization protein A [Alphaproteobacteria bacterium]|nr:pyrimidine utilization protein A [Alphaproteobacteria bacterium]